MKVLFLCLIALSSLYGTPPFDLDSPPLVTCTKRIILDEFPHAYNPSLIKTDGGFLLTFRYTSNEIPEGWISYIGLVRLNEAFDPISDPILLNTRAKNSKTASQAEDARIFSYKGGLFVIYNDNRDVIASWLARRDMFIAELRCEEDEFILSPPLKLVYEEGNHMQLWQKNWVPFEWNGMLLVVYSINPHKILYINPINGSCYPFYETSMSAKWEWGTLRGSTPPQLVDGEYLAFFHSGTITSSSASWGSDAWHYFMGAYTFSPNPPFEITKMSPEPIVADDFYPPSFSEKKVIFPGGFVVSGPHIYVAYGKNDCEIWIATLDKEALKSSLKCVEK